jgi:hypothetical protein
MYDEQLPLDAVILGSISGGIALGTPFSSFLSPTWALLIGCFCGLLVAIWIKFAQPKVAKSVKLLQNCTCIASDSAVEI